MRAATLTTLSAATDLVLIAVLVRAVVTDVRSRRIGNPLTGAAIAAGVLLHAIAGGVAGVPTSLIGLVVGAAVLLVPYLAGGIGAGDLKLLAAIGALKGAPFVLVAAICTGLAGGAFALIYLVGRRGLPGAVRWFEGALTAPRHRSGPVTMPYGPAIAAGTLVSLLLQV
jgi:prepilin peptidase CpaA